MASFRMESFLPEYDGDKVQILSAAGFHGFSVAHRIFVFLRQPVGPDLLVALHLLNGEDFCAAASADNAGPVIHVVQVVQLLRRL